MRYLFWAFAIATSLTLTTPTANAFDIQFSWEGLKLCTTGNPNRVSNPKFILKDVPAGTKYIRFKLIDRDVPQYDHGGGVVAYTGQKTIAPGAFKYKSPCPPGGRHTYEWRTTAQLRKNGSKLGQAKAARKYP